MGKRGREKGTFDRVSGSTSHIALLAILPHLQSVGTASQLVAVSVFSTASSLPKLACAKKVNWSSEVWRCEYCSGELEPGGCSILVTKGCGFQPSENRPMTLQRMGSLCKATFLPERSRESRCLHRWEELLTF